MGNTQDNIFDSILKKKLDKERLSPTNDVWSRIDASLSSKEKSQKYLLWWTRGIAASITLFIALFTIFDSSENVLADHNEKMKQNQEQLANFKKIKIDKSEPILIESETSPDFESEFVKVNDEPNADLTKSESLNKSINTQELPIKIKEVALFIKPKTYRIDLVQNSRSTPYVGFVAENLPVIPINEEISSEYEDEGNWIVFEDEVKKTNKWQTIAAIALVQTNTSSLISQEVNQLSTTGENYNAEANLLNQINVDYSQSYSATMQLGYAVSKKLMLNTGLTLSNFQGDMNAAYAVTETSTTYNTYMLPVAGPAGTGSFDMIEVTEEVVNTTESIDTATHSFKQQYVEIPITARYHIGEKKIIGFIESGVATRIGTSYQESVSLNANSQMSNQSSFSSAMNSTEFNWLFGAGAKYRITESWNLSVSPMYRVGLKTNDNPVSNSNTWSFFTGIGFEF